MRSNQMDNLLAAIKNGPVTSRVLERKLSVSGAYLRQMVNRLRRNGEIIGSGKDGYYYCKTAKETKDVIENLTSRCRGMQSAIKGMKKGAPEKLPPKQARLL